MRTFSVILFICFSKVLFAQDSILTVDEAIREAISKNYSIEMVKNDIEIGRLNNNWVNAGAYPTISATANKSIGSNTLDQRLSNGTSTKRSGATVGNTNAGLNVNWVAFNGYRMFATKKRLEELERQGEFNFQRQVNTIAFDVVTSYLNIVRYNQQAKAINEQIRLSQDRLFIAESRFRIGTGAKNDVLQAQVDLNEQKAIQLNLQNNRDIAINDLNRLMRRPPSDRYNVADTITLDPLPDSLTLKSRIDIANPDVLLARSNLAVLVQSRREINSERLPVVTLNGNYNFVRNKNSAGLTLFNQTYGPSASIGVAVPIWNGGAVKRQLKVADIQYKNQQLLLEQTREDLDARVASAFTNYRNALTVVELERTNFGYLRENIFIARERFRQLVITSIELRQVQISLIEAQTRMYDALYRAKLAEAELKLLTGDIAR